MLLPLALEALLCDFWNQIYGGGFAPQRAWHSHFATSKLESFPCQPWEHSNAKPPTAKRWIPAGFASLHFTIDGAQSDKVACFLSAGPGLNEFGSMIIASFSASPKCLGPEKGYKFLGKDSILPSLMEREKWAAKQQHFNPVILNLGHFKMGELQTPPVLKLPNFRNTVLI